MTKPTIVPAVDQRPNGKNTAAAVRPPLRAIRADKITMRSIIWLDRPFLQGSAFHLVTGPKGVGKGTYLAMVVANVTTGKYGAARNVLIVSSEDSASIDLAPRLVAAGADLTRVTLVVDDLVLPEDLDRLRDLAATIGDIGMIIIDPVGNHLGGVDTDREGAIRHALAGLNQLADDLACSILGVRHLAKNRANGALASVLGSTAWVDLPRAVLMLARDDEDDMVFHIQVIAGNRSGRGAGQAFRIELRDVGLLEPVTCAVSLGESAKDVEDLLQTKRPLSRSQSARDLILTILEDEGEQESEVLDARVAGETGISARTVRNLRVTLNNEGLIKSLPAKDEFGGILHWRVVRTSAPRPTGEAPK